MKQFSVLPVVTGCMLLCACTTQSGIALTPLQPELGSRSVAILTIDGLRFRDLNRNGTLDAYEDWRRSPAERTRSLLSLMTLEEKAGVMMHGTIPLDRGRRDIDFAATRLLIHNNLINTFLTRQSVDATTLAASHNRLQMLAEQTRLAIPLSISTDPRNHFQHTVGQSVAAGGFSKWPEPLGMAAINDPILTRQMGDIARQEYRAVGITQALSPQADLATEPRWSRVFSTFGEDAELARSHVQAYVEGFQHGSTGLRPGSVVAVVKHWAGYGAAKDGWDSHSPYGKHMTFPKRNFEYHLKPFDGAFAAKVASVMPTYSIPDGSVVANGVTLEQVGGAFSKTLITTLLRQHKGFQGVVLSDWAVTNDCTGPCQDGAPKGSNPLAFFPQWGTPWGVEHLSQRARFVKAVQAGLDQFGGTEASSMLVDAVKAGELTSQRLDESVTRILLQKFQQGLFENPFVDETQAMAKVNTLEFQNAALAAQRRSLVLLQNKASVLPLASRHKKVFLHGIDAKVAAQYGFQVVGAPEQADVAIIRAATPFEKLHPTYIFGMLTHEGSLAFRDGNPDFEAVKRASASVPTIVTVYLDRPAILTNIVDKAHAVLGNFGTSDSALFDVLTGKASPQGKLPVELPSSEAAVAAQQSDTPRDSAAPLFPFGHGLSY